MATVIPVYNEVEHIEACLLSLLEQTIEPARHMIVVLDGGSTDGTQRVVKGIMEEHQGDDYPQLSFMENPNRTVAHARNLALSTLPDSVEFLVELIGLRTVPPDHLESRLQAWAACQDEVGDRLSGLGVRVCLQTKRRLEQHVGSTGPWHRPSVAAVGSSANSVGENRRRYRPLSCTAAHRSTPLEGGMNPSSPARTVNFPCVC